MQRAAYISRIQRFRGAIAPLGAQCAGGFTPAGAE